ncbi:MAG TPA: hypothetical protein VFE51_01525 [Verrucomicrobiae bacterium]|nr:hypothetical protein [Verrucomicrobiae bacterium]
MKVISHALLILVAASLGLAVGFTWKSRLRPGATIGTASGLDAKKLELTQTNGGTKKVRVPRDDSPLATSLERDLSRSSGVIKWLCWMSALEKAQATDFPRLAKLARGNQAVWRAVVNRWVEIAPRNLFDTLVNVSKFGGDLPVSELGQTLFGQWPKQDPDAAIAALTEAGDIGMRDTWRLKAAMAVIENNAEQGLQLMSQWHINHFGPSMGAVDAWAAANPQHAAQFIIANPAGYASQVAMDSVGEAWAKTDPAAALVFAVSQNNDLGSRLASTVLKQWAGRNLKDAADWLAGTDDQTRNQLSPAFVQTWAQQDSAAALSWCEENLQGPQLTQAVNGVMKGATSKDVAGAAAMVSNMQASPARAEAAAVVAQNWFPHQFNSSEPVKPETLSWLSGLDPGSVKAVLSQVSWSWAESDSQSMAKFLSSANNNEVPSYIDSILSRQWARTDPTAALDWAASLPETRGLAAGSDAFSVWHQSQPDSAMAWLQGLPAGDGRRQPFFQSMVESLASDPQVAGQLSSMSASDQAAAQAIIAKMTLPEDQRARVLASLKPH